MRDLLPRVDALLDKLGVSSRVTGASPSFRRFLAEGVEWGVAEWEAGEVRVSLTRHGHATLRHEGGEAAVLRLWARVSGLQGSAQLLLDGRPGALLAFLVEGDEKGVVESAWREVCSLGPGPRRKRDAWRPAGVRVLGPPSEVLEARVAKELTVDDARADLRGRSDP